MVKVARLDDAFLEVFLIASKPSRRSITAAKRKEKERKEKPQKMSKIVKPKDTKKHQNVQETPFFAKSSGVQWVNVLTFQYKGSLMPTQLDCFDSVNRALKSIF